MTTQLSHPHRQRGLAPAAAHPALRNAILPRALKAGPHRTNLHVLENATDFGREDRVSIHQQVPRRSLERERLAQLLGDPRRRGMRRRVHVQHRTTIVLDHEEHVEKP
jgi:hypothetical protein